MIRYRPLFQVDIAHDYFLSRGDVVFEAQPEADRFALASHYSVDQFLQIVPDECTHARLAGHKMIFRATAAGFMVAVKLDASASDIRPAVPPLADFKLTFAMRVRDARFANYTELGPSNNGFYRFGNDSQNRVAEVSCLSRPVAAFDPARRYVAGEIRAQAAAPTVNLFIALRDTGPAATPVGPDWRRIPADTFDLSVTYQSGAIVLSANQVYRALVDGPGTDFTNAAEWKPLGALANQYASVADTIILVGNLLNLDISDSALPRATIRVFRAGNTTAAWEQTFVAEQGTLTQVQVDLRSLAPGLYRIDVLDDALVIVPGRSLPIYVAPIARTSGWFGVIDIGLGAGDFSLFNANGTLRAPRYTLRFLNRATRWRYIFPSAQPVGAGADVAPEAGDNRVLVTAAPRPLTRFGAGSRLQADVAATPTVSEEIVLPAPETNRIRRESAEWYSETYLPNLTLGP